MSLAFFISHHLYNFFDKNILTPKAPLKAAKKCSKTQQGAENRKAINVGYQFRKEEV